MQKRCGRGSTAEQSASNLVLRGERLALNTPAYHSLEPSPVTSVEIRHHDPRPVKPVRRVDFDLPAGHTRERSPRRGSRSHGGGARLTRARKSVVEKGAADKRRFGSRRAPKTGDQKGKRFREVPSQERPTPAGGYLPDREDPERTYSPTRAVDLPEIRIM